MAPGPLVHSVFSVCPFGYYGTKCLRSCGCGSNTHCRRNNGACEPCPEGFRGPQCTEGIFTLQENICIANSLKSNPKQLSVYMYQYYKQPDTWNVPYTMCIVDIKGTVNQIVLYPRSSNSEVSLHVFNWARDITCCPYFSYWSYFLGAVKPCPAALLLCFCIFFNEYYIGHFNAYLERQKRIGLIEYS